MFITVYYFSQSLFLHILVQDGHPLWFFMEFGVVLIFGNAFEITNRDVNLSHTPSFSNQRIPIDLTHSRSKKSFDFGLNCSILAHSRGLKM